MQSIFEEASKMADIHVGRSPPVAKKRCKVVDLSSNNELTSIDAKVHSCLEKEKQIHVNNFSFPVELKVKVIKEDSFQVECGICCRWTSINIFNSKKLCHLKDHFNTSLHLSYTELQKSRVEGHAAELPKLQANREILRQSF